MQQTIFDVLYPKFKIDKPIRLIELFAGYGSQALALKYLGVSFEHWKICEWAIKSIQAYKDLHFPNGFHPFGVLDIPKEEIIDFLYEKGISSNYNEPMTLEQIKRLKEETLYNIYENIYVTNNLVNIQQVKAEDLEIKDIDKYCYIMTYSFPCQDLSLAGKGKGMSDTSTRSGMLWEVERILTECYELKTLPQVLLMENVPQVHGTDNVQDFNKWQLRLEELGYKNYFQDLIGTDYGIPQTRNRCFMVSILGDYSYTFPKPITLKLKLKDMLEDEVDEKYYLSDKMIKCPMKEESNGYPRRERFEQSLNKTNNIGIANTLTTLEGQRDCSTFIKNNYCDVGVAECIGTYQFSKSDKFMNNKDRLQIGKETSDTLQTTQKEAIVEKFDLKTELCNKLIENGMVKENDVIRHSYSNSRMNDWDKRNVEFNNISPTLDTRCDCLGVVNNMRIRKLTPREAFRLMGVKDEDYELIAKNQSDSSLYHLAGDSIIVPILCAIFKEML